MDTEPHQHNNAGIPVQAPRQAESSTTLSLGERLLPFLFAAMEACCVAMLLIGLAGISFLGASAPFFPLWAVFVALPGACWFVRYRRHLLAARSSKELLNGTALLVMAAIFAALAIPWLLH